MKSESEVTQSCPTLCDPWTVAQPSSSVHGTLQARIWEWVAISFSRGSSRPRDQTQISCIASRRFNLWATGECTQINSTVNPPSVVLVSLTLSEHGYCWLKPRTEVTYRENQGKKQKLSPMLPSLRVSPLETVTVNSGHRNNPQSFPVSKSADSFF